MPDCFEDRLGIAGMKLRSSIGADDHDAVGFTSSQSCPHSSDSKVHGHPAADGVPHDPVGEQVLDRAAVDIDLRGRMSGQVRDPRALGNTGGAVTAQQTIVNRRPGSFAFAAFLN